MSADPAGPVDGPNLYVYVSGNPVRKNDPGGMAEADATMVFTPEDVFTESEYAEYLQEDYADRFDYRAAGQTIDNRKDEITFVDQSESTLRGYADSFIEGAVSMMMAMGAPDGRSLMVADPKVRAANERAYRHHSELSDKVVEATTFGAVEGAEEEYNAGKFVGTGVQLVLGGVGLAKSAYGASSYARMGRALKEVAEETPEIVNAIDEVVEIGQEAIEQTGRRAASETQGAVTNLGSRSVASNAELFASLPEGEGMSGVFDHATGRFLIRHSTTASPLPRGSVARYGGHSAVRRDLGLALGEDLSSASSGRLSGFSLSKQSEGAVSFGWNSGQINPGSHGSRSVPESLRPIIESAVRGALGL